MILVVILTVLLILAAASLLLRARGVVAFFHPYCAAGGGGERVLWAAVRALNESYPHVRLVVYSGDLPALTPKQILRTAGDRFGIEIPADSVVFVQLRSRWLLEGSTWPVATLFGQTVLGGLVVSLEALFRLVPEVMVDTMGAPMTLPVFRLLAGVKVGCYVHYPTISTDMVGRVRERKETYNNRGLLARSPVAAALKLAYYQAFALAYGLIGKASQV